MDEAFEKFKQSILDLDCSWVSCKDCPYQQDNIIGFPCDLGDLQKKMRDMPKDERLEAIKLLNDLINDQIGKGNRDIFHKALSVLEEGSRK